MRKTILTIIFFVILHQLTGVTRTFTINDTQYNAIENSTI